MEVTADYEKRVFKVKLPMRTSYDSGRKSRKKNRKKVPKQTALNLNVYRNLHFRSLSAQKNTFTRVAKKLLQGVPDLGVIRLHYDVYPNSKRRLDIMNIGSIVDKYFSDTLTEMGIIEDDDYTHIDFVSFGFGEVVQDEHVLVTITEIKPRSINNMRVILDQSDIEDVLVAYVKTQGISDQVAAVELNTNEGGDWVAEIILKGTETVAEPPAKKRGRGGRPAGSKNKPKEEPVTNVDTTVEDNSADSHAGTVESKSDSASDESTPPFTPTTPVVDSPPAEQGGGKESRNPFDDSPEVSSSDTPEVVAKVEPVKKSSIFDR